MSKRGTLYYVEMGAWGLLNIDDPTMPKQQRKQFFRALQSELRNYDTLLHVTHYDYGGGRLRSYVYSFRHGGITHTSENFRTICAVLLRTIKPSNPKE